MLPDLVTPEDRAPGAGSILALDLGINTGWALCSRGKIEHGVVRLKPPSKTEGFGMQFLRFRVFLHRSLDVTGELSQVIYELVQFGQRGHQAGQIYGGFRGTLCAWCEQKRIPYDGLSTATLKKFMTGNGRAEKREMIEHVRMLGHEPKDHNAADALALLYYALAQEKGDKPF